MPPLTSQKKCCNRGDLGSTYATPIKIFSIENYKTDFAKGTNKYTEKRIESTQ